jgi:hypothetical protein
VGVGSSGGGGVVVSRGRRRKDVAGGGRAAIFNEILAWERPRGRRFQGGEER